MADVSMRLMQLSMRGYCCSQILLILGLEAQGKTNPDLVRAMNGLCLGVGTGEEICGALSGAACLLSLYAGKGTDAEKNECLSHMIQDMVEWFHVSVGDRHGGVKCFEILGRSFERGPDLSRCGSIVADTYRQAQAILERYGFSGPEGSE